jgi:diaminopimelate decarboxylase
VSSTLDSPSTTAAAAVPYEPLCDALSPNRNLTPITTRLDAEGRLEVGGCRLSDLARTYGTPLYVLDEATLRATCRAYREALASHYPGPSLALYASKANSSLAITALVASEGLGLDAVSAGELLTALQGGMPPERIVLHGNNKSLEEVELAVRHGVTVVVDNWHDLELLAQVAPEQGAPVRLMVRFTPGIECHTHEYIRTGHLDSKFGFDPDQLEAVLRHLSGCSWATLDGLHAHIGSQIFELEPHRDLAGVMADALALARSLGHPCTDLNVGGGLGIRYVDGDDPPSIQAWVQEVGEAVSEACRARNLALPRLLCEPGRSHPLQRGQHQGHPGPAHLRVGGRRHERQPPADHLPISVHRRARRSSPGDRDRHGDPGRQALRIRGCAAQGAGAAPDLRR